MALNARLAGAVSLAIGLNMAGAVASKYLALNLQDVLFAGVWGVLLIGVYGARMKYWVWAGRRYQLSFLYPFMSLSYVISLAIGFTLFGEEVTGSRVLGSLLIMAGVLTVGLSKNGEEEVG